MYMNYISTNLITWVITANKNLSPAILKHWDFSKFDIVSMTIKDWPAKQ